MSDARRTRFNSEVLLRSLGTSAGAMTSALNHQQLEELHEVADASGVKLSVAAPVAGTYDTVVLAPAASPTNTLTIKATVVGAGTGLSTVEVKDAAGDTLAVTNVAGVLTISLANTTDSKNTLTLVKAAIDAANDSTVGATHGLLCFITGTGSTQMVHGGTNTLAAVSASAAVAGTSLKSASAGVAQSPSVAAGPFTVVPA